MSPTAVAVILIVGGYLYGTLLYEPWYQLVQTRLLKWGILKPTQDPNARLLGNQIQIVMLTIILIGAGIWLFVLSNN